MSTRSCEQFKAGEQSLEAMNRLALRLAFTGRCFLRRGLQFGHDLLGDLARLFERSRLERNRSHAGMASATVTLADRRQVMVCGRFLPGIGADRDFRAEARRTYAYAVKAVRKQIVGGELDRKS